VDWLHVAAAMKEQTAVLLTGFLLISYLLGSLIRLRAADRVDERSAFLHGDRTLLEALKALFGWDLEVPGEKEWNKLDDQFEKLTADSLPLPWPQKGVEEMRELWEKDSFPYPVWLFMRLKVYSHSEKCTFFRSYKQCFGKAERRGKEFLNYCKLVVYQASAESGGGLAEEVRSAEAFTRFFAGTFYALLWSSGALFLSALLPLLGREIHWSRMGLGLALALVSLYMAKQIVADGRFRNLRIKEVDIAFDAFYLIHRHAEACAKCTTPPLERLVSE
jgi:hypothetical protein